MLGPVLTTLIREIADEPLLLDPTAHDVEVRENTWSLSDEEFPSVADVEAAFHECASLLRQRVRALGHRGTATFYVWHDAQSGFLKCSTTTLPANELPFGARVELTALDEVVRVPRRHHARRRHVRLRDGG